MRFSGIIVIMISVFMLTGCASETKKLKGSTDTSSGLQAEEAEMHEEAGEEIRETGNSGSPEHITEESAPPEEYLIEDFPVILQMPELPTGCEITSMTMVLNYYGFPADKMEMASRYLPVLSSPDTYYGEDGRLYGNDINQYFIGDPETEDGIICGTGAIVAAADSFLEDCGSSMRAEDRTGASPEELYQFVSEDVPVVVWCTIEMQDRMPEQGWYTENGDYVDWGTNDHGAVLIGYTPDTVTIADPISGLAEYSREEFESVFALRSNQCVILR